MPIIQKGITDCRKRMSGVPLQDVLRSVEILYDPASSQSDKNTASTILSQLSDSPNYSSVAMEILLSNDPCCCFSLFLCIALTFNARFYSLNLLINMLNKDWNKIPTMNQITIIDFLEKYLISNVTVFVFYCYLIWSWIWDEIVLLVVSLRISMLQQWLFAGQVNGNHVLILFINAFLIILFFYYRLHWVMIIF